MASTSLSDYVTAGVLALLCAGLALPASAEVLQAGGVYSAGTTLEAPQYGVAFTLPEGWIGALPPGSALVLMKAERKDVEAYIYAGIERMTLEQARSMMQGDLDAEGDVVFHPRGELRAEGSTLSGEYSVTGSENVTEGWVRTLLSEQGWAVSFLAHSSPDHVEILQRALDAICRSVELSEPAEDGASTREAPPGGD